MHRSSAARHRAGAWLATALVATLLAGAGVTPVVAAADITGLLAGEVSDAPTEDEGGTGEPGGVEPGEQEDAREVATLLRRVLGIAVAAVILLLVVGLPLRGWLRRRR